jgi:hypothetical protein
MSPLTIGSFDRCSRANGTVYAKEMCWPISMRRFSTVKSLKGTCRRRWHSVTRNESYGGGPSRHVRVALTSCAASCLPTSSSPQDLRTQSQPDFVIRRFSGQVTDWHGLFRDDGVRPESTALCTMGPYNQVDMRRHLSRKSAAMPKKLCRKSRPIDLASEWRPDSI